MLRSSRNAGGRFVSSLAALVTTGESMTRQSDAKGTDIAMLVRRFTETGAMPMTPVPPRFADFTDAPDFSTLMHRIVKARESFEALPWKLRERFVTMENFVKFCDNPENAEEMVKLNLAVKREPVAEPKPAEVVIVEDKRASGRKSVVKGDAAD